MVEEVKIEVNGETKAFAQGATVEQVVKTLCNSNKGVAVALNSEVVPRSAWATTALAAGDRVEVLTAAQGG